MTITEDRALHHLLKLLDRQDYRFVTPTPATHARVLARRQDRIAESVEDVLGWSMPFGPGTIDPNVETALGAAGMLEIVGSTLRSRVRVSRLHERLHLHSAFPTNAEDAVFFGPDTYRFTNFVEAELSHCPSSPKRIADVGTGTGAGAILIASAYPEAEVFMTDINPAALRFAGINAAYSRVAIAAVGSAGLDRVGGRLDLIAINPPYMAGASGRKYRDGGGMLGARTSLELARQAVAKLASGGRLLLYSGSAIVRGQDAMRRSLGELADAFGCRFSYRELDPDIFGEELEQPAYAKVDRIAAVGAVITRVKA